MWFQLYFKQIICTFIKTEFCIYIVNGYGCIYLLIILLINNNIMCVGPIKDLWQGWSLVSLLTPRNTNKGTEPFFMMADQIPNPTLSHTTERSD